MQNEVGVIVRVPFDEGSLTGKFTLQTTFDQGDFRSRYFGGDRLGRTVQRVERIREVVGASEPALATAALKFALKPMAVSTVIPGMRNVRQAEMNLAISEMPEMPNQTELLLRDHLWRRSFWYTA